MPFVPDTENEKGSLRKAADMATSGAVGLGSGLALGMHRNLQPWEQEAVNEHPDINNAANVAGNAVTGTLAGTGLASLLKGASGVAGGILGRISPNLSKLASLFKSGGPKSLPEQAASDSTLKNLPRDGGAYYGPWR